MPYTILIYKRFFLCFALSQKKTKKRNAPFWFSALQLLRRWCCRQINSKCYFSFDKHSSKTAHRTISPMSKHSVGCIMPFFSLEQMMEAGQLWCKDGWGWINGNSEGKPVKRMHKFSLVCLKVQHDVITKLPFTQSRPLLAQQYKNKLLGHFCICISDCPFFFSKKTTSNKTSNVFCFIGDFGDNTWTNCSEFTIFCKRVSE